MPHAMSLRKGKSTQLGNKDSSPSLGFMVVEPAASKKAAAFANWRAKRARVLVNLLLRVIPQFYVLRNYAIPQFMPHAIPQTHSVFYPYRSQIPLKKVKWILLSPLVTFGMNGDIVS